MAKPIKVIVLTSDDADAVADLHAEDVARAFLLDDRPELRTSNALVIIATTALIAEDVADACMVEVHDYRYELAPRGTEEAGSFPGAAPSMMNIGIALARRTLAARDAFRDEPSEMDLPGALSRMGWTFHSSSPGKVVFQNECGDQAWNTDLKGIIWVVFGMTPDRFWARDKQIRGEQRRAQESKP